MQKTLVLVLLVLLSCVHSSWAAPHKISVNQFVEHPSLDAVLLGFQDYLKENGVEAEYSVHTAQANMGTAGQIAKQMLGEDADLFLSITTPSSQACAQALSRAPEALKKPLLFTAVTNPVAAGLVKDLQHPKNNITGVADKLPLKEHLQMLLEYVPRAKRIGVLYNAGEINSKATVTELKRLAAKMNIKIVEATVSKTADVYQAANSLVGRVDLVFIPTDNTIISALESVLKVGIQNQMPIFSADVDSVKRGTVAAMGFDYYKHGRQTGAMAERIFKGTAPADIPVEFQKDLELYINLTASKKMGLTPPETLIKKASHIIK
ncbi:ABC transporter substrate-binding protein [Desulfotalea psychrophila]|uniref:ABC transporter, periplasmic substrate-binding protein n=1 Tax=Desulfotalea psychrophila (strain LSv54 / DSM 12343) TaxID=177439 RepID=Q6AIK1_DESPS|nr:ABC transporter substrate-binding protein [Desulfotalea psychrophila]CAG37829.1 hypothetical protein DP3100 [Desulfotalea psychrophila LSv54]